MPTNGLKMAGSEYLNRRKQSYVEEHDLGYYIGKISLTGSKLCSRAQCRIGGQRGSSRVRLIGSVATSLRLQILYRFPSNAEFVASFCVSAERTEINRARAIPLRLLQPEPI